jgi:ketosteroid isomerase-like protein
MTKIHFAGAVMTLVAVTCLAACNTKKYFGPVITTSAASKAAALVKADVAEMVQQFNSHDASRVASHDAPDVVHMVHGAANLVGPAANLESNRQFFAANPDTQLTLSDETVDLSSAADMAVVRATYVLTRIDPKSLATVSERGNYAAGYKVQSDSSWKMIWSVLSDTQPPAAPAAKN